MTLFVVPPRNSTVSVENEPAGAGYAAAEDECTGANTSDSVDGATGGDGTALQGTEGSTDRPPPSLPTPTHFSALLLEEALCDCVAGACALLAWSEGNAKSRSSTSVGVARTAYRTRSDGADHWGD